MTTIYEVSMQMQRKIPLCVECSNYLEAIVLLIVWLIMLKTKLVLRLLLVEVGLVMMLLMILLLMIKSEALVIKVERRRAKILYIGLQQKNCLIRNLHCLAFFT